MLQLSHFFHNFLQIFVPVLNNAHWTVYCINKVHKQIDILDPQNWEQKDDKNRHHMRISEKFRERLNNAFQLFAGPSFPNISNWTLPYINVLTQNPKDDYAFFCMLYLENYDGGNREMVLKIDKVS